MELPEHAHEFLAAVSAERGLSRNTADAYRRDLIQYHATWVDTLSFQEAERVQEHLSRLRDAGLADASIARKFASIRAFHRFLVSEGLEETDPTVSINPPSRPSSLPKALTVEDVTAVIEGVGTSTPLGRRDRAILEFLYGTGCRVSELTQLDAYDVDLTTRTALVTGKGKKQRMVPVGTHAAESIEAWLPDRLEFRKPGSDSGALFLSTRGNRLSRQSIWRIVKARGQEAGLADKDLFPHVFRHSAATHMVEGGADLRSVQEILGHSSLSTTQVYTRVRPEHLLEIITTSHPRGG